jgi:hypothetical protein
MIAHNPLHRSGREALPHPAPTSGTNAKTHPGIGMANPNRGKPSSNQSLHSLPGQTMPLASMPQYPTPKPSNSRPKGNKTPTIHRNPIITHMPKNHRSQISPLLRNGLMQTSHQLCLQFLKLRLPPLAHRLTHHCKPSRSRSGTDMGKTKEVKRLRLPFPPPHPIGPRKTTKLNQTRLARMKPKPKLPKPLPQFNQEPFGLLTILKPNNEVIPVAHHYHVSMRPLPPPLLDPEVKYIVKIKISQKRTNTSSLNCPHLTLYPLPILQHTRSQPLLDKSHDAPICHTMLDKPHQPLMLQGIEKLLDISIEHPAYFLRTDPNRKGIQSLMRTTPKPKPIRESEKVRLIDRIQYLEDGTLDNLILQRRDSERPSPPVRLRDGCPTNRLCPVSPPPKPLRKSLKIRLQIPPILPPCLSIYTRGRLPIQCKIGRPQSLNGINMVQKGRKPQLPIPPSCLTYSFERMGHTHPALCPECVTLKQVPLGQPPSLHPLRSLSQGLVQRLPRYYETVRLPAPAYHRRVSSDFPMQSVNSTDRDGISRLPFKVFPHMHGVSDHAGLNASRAIDAPSIAFRHPDGVGVPEDRSLAMNLISWLNTQPMRTPVNASLSPLRVTTHDSEPVWIATPSLYGSFIHYTLPVSPAHQDLG